MSSSESAPALAPTSTGNRFAVITDDDHTGILWIVSILCFIYTLMIFFLRLEARRKNFGLDDVLAIIGTLFASIQYILIFAANDIGLGKSYTLINDSDAEKISKYIRASEILLLLALGFAKCSVISLCRRLFSSHRSSHRLFCDIAMGACALWSIASILAITVNCSSFETMGYKTPYCYNLNTRWAGIGIADSITEIVIVGMAFDGLRPLQMSIHRKLQALATFILRLVIIVFAVLHITSLRKATTSANTGVAMTVPTIYLQVELLYALLSASIPALNRWLRNFDTSMGSTWMHTSQVYSIGNSKSGRDDSQSMPLESVDRVGRSKRNSRVSRFSKSLPAKSSAGMKSGEFAPPGPKYSVSTEAYAASPSSDTRDRPASTGMNSEDMIIRKDVQWHVQYEREESLRKGSV